MSMAGHLVTLSEYDSLLERADRFRRIQLEHVYNLVPATGYEPRVVDPCNIQTAGCVGDQVIPSLLRQRAFSYHCQQGTVSPAFC